MDAPVAMPRGGGGHEPHPPLAGERGPHRPLAALHAPAPRALGSAARSGHAAQELLAGHAQPYPADVARPDGRAPGQAATSARAGRLRSDRGAAADARDVAATHPPGGPGIAQEVRRAVVEAQLLGAVERDRIPLAYGHRLEVAERAGEERLARLVL